MEKEAEDKARLSGWVRLWIVSTAAFWISGAFDVALSAEPFRLPLPLNEASAQSIRLVMWFLGPLVFAAVWIAARWVWRGFRPVSDRMATPHTATPEIASCALENTSAVLDALVVSGFWAGRFMLALGVLAIATAFAVAFPYLVMSSEVPSSFLIELAGAVHFLLFFGLGISLFKDIMGMSKDDSQRLS